MEAGVYGRACLSTPLMPFGTWRGWILKDIAQLLTVVYLYCWSIRCRTAAGILLRGLKWKLDALPLEAPEPQLITAPH